MKKTKILCLLLVVVMLLTLMGCGEKRTVTCDSCGTDIKLKADSNITDEWIVFCKDCELELFGEEGIVAAE